MYVNLKLVTEIVFLTYTLNRPKGHKQTEDVDY